MWIIFLNSYRIHDSSNPYNIKCSLLLWHLHFNLFLPLVQFWSAQMISFLTENGYFVQVICRWLQPSWSLISSNHLENSHLQLFSWLNKWLLCPFPTATQQYISELSCYHDKSISIYHFPFSSLVSQLFLKSVQLNDRRAGCIEDLLHRWCGTSLTQRTQHSQYFILLFINLIKTMKQPTQ